MNIQQIKSAVKLLWQVKATPVLIGARGMGKTDFVGQVAEEMGFDGVEILHLGQIGDPGDLLGLGDFITDEKTGKKVATKFFKPDWWPRGKDDKKIIFLDEINRSRQEIQNVVFELLNKGSLHGDPLPDGCRVIAAMNPPTADYNVAETNDDAWNDRFCHIKFEPTLEEWVDYMMKGKFDASDLAFFKANPEHLDGKIEHFSLDYIKPSRRSAHRLLKIKALNPDMEIFKEIAIGFLGIAAGTSYMAYLAENQLSVPGIEVINNFSKVKEKIERFSDPKTDRKDSLKKTMDEVLIEVKARTDVVREDARKKDELFSPNVVENLTEFMLVLPADIALVVARELIVNDYTTDHIKNHDGLVEKFKKYNAEAKEALALVNR